MQYKLSKKDNPYRGLLEEALASGTFTQLRAAVAYATAGGFEVLNDLFKSKAHVSWPSMEKKWLVGIDWCRSDASAMTRLDGLPKSSVKVPDGKAVIAASGCVPSQSFHPKLFVLTNATHAVVVCGSGNLSRNALLKSCEAGCVLTLDRNGAEASALIKEFDAKWAAATPYGGIKSQYVAACRSRAHAKKLIPTEDDTKPPSGGLSDEQIHEMRTYKNLWIDGGPLGGNFGGTRPGNQLDLKRYSRAFFGFDTSQAAFKGEVTLWWENEQHTHRTMRNGGNGMDKLNVPTPGVRGEQFYAGRTLLFTRREDGAYDFAAGVTKQRAVWRKTSEDEGVVYKLSKAREFGLF